ncbi:hypothetical protein A2U01_0005924 [Trifolium medium]|uniref:Uncharacterized protein n=1 Tax=Trifolium medium TaxID=97028 RepID=A0A392MC52_9FABA|nr:hypothetical protein [Trifolium medium]
MAATTKYRDVTEFCKAASANKGSHFEDVLAGGPNLSDNLRAFSKEYAKDYVKKHGFVGGAVDDDGLIV